MESVEVLNRMAQITKKFFNQKDWESLTKTILFTSIELCEADRGTIFLSPRFRSKNKKSNEVETLTSWIATGMNGQEISLDATKGIAGYVYQTKSPLRVKDVEKDKRFYPGIDDMTHYHSQSILCVPLLGTDGDVLGVVELLNHINSDFSEQDQKLLEIMSLFAGIALEKMRSLNQLEDQNESLKSEGNKNYVHLISDNLLFSRNRDMKSLLDSLPAYAKSDSSVLICGESGTGKEIIARFIHNKSPRHGESFVVVNCAAIPESLFEAELFGVSKGAATGTLPRKGKIELADDGTLFLDEIGELPLSMQAKLLRVLQEKEVCQIGSDSRPRSVDFRLLAATNRNLKQMVKEGKFREDLYYRLNVIEVHLPSLRNRMEDIEIICESILKNFENSRGWKLKTISERAMTKVIEYNWPGNIRELQNRLENAYILARDSEEIEESHLNIPASNIANEEPNNIIPFPMHRLKLKEAKKELEKHMIIEALEACDGNKTAASHRLGITREGLRKAIKSLKIA